jgi:endoglucanase
VTQVKFAPRAGWESRMVGGEIQASNTANFSSGVVTLFTITSTPTAGVLTTASFTNTAAYQYYRYIGPANSYCDIAELEFEG